MGLGFMGRVQGSMTRYHSGGTKLITTAMAEPD